MRVSREMAAKNREAVVETAATLFREKGYDGLGLAPLMQEVGLTHGGFYKQFASKSALIEEATARMLAQNLDGFRRVLEANPTAPLPALIAYYLSPEAIEAPGRACTFAALAAEAPRQGEALQALMTQGIEDLAGVVLQALGGDPALRPLVLRQLAMLVGTLTLARATADPGLRAELIAAAMA